MTTTIDSYTASTLSLLHREVSLCTGQSGMEVASELNRVLYCATKRRGSVKKNLEHLRKLQLAHLNNVAPGRDLFQRPPAIILCYISMAAPYATKEDSRGRWQTFAQSPGISLHAFHGTRSIVRLFRVCPLGAHTRSHLDDCCRLRFPLAFANIDRRQVKRQAAFVLGTQSTDSSRGRICKHQIACNSRGVNEICIFVENRAVPSSETWATRHWTRILKNRRG